MSAVVDLVARRRTLALMARQEIKGSYGRYRLGLLWTLMEPFAMAILLYVVFAFVLGRAEGIGLEPFIVYLVTGLLPFQWLSHSVRKGPKVFRRHAALITLSPLPVSAWPLRSVLVGGVEMALSVPVVAVLMVIFGASLTWGIVFLPVAVALQVVLCAGAAMLGAALSLRFPDIEQLTGMVMRVFFWTSPILWSARLFPEPIQLILYFNPFYLILDLYRAPIWPDDVLPTPIDAAKSLVVIAATFVAGWVLLSRRVRDARRVQ